VVLVSTARRCSVGALAAVALLAACGAPQDTAERPTVNPIAPSPVRLVGTLNPAVTQTTIRTTICVAGWTAKVRPPASYTSALERRQIRELGLPGTAADYEEDHLMPLTLGGAPRDPKNLRPVLLAVAKKHDVWEVRLRNEVCNGTSTLAATRARMSEIKAALR